MVEKMKKIVLLLLCFMLLLTGCSSQSDTKDTIGNADGGKGSVSGEETSSPSDADADNSSQSPSDEGSSSPSDAGEESSSELKEIMDKMQEAAKNLPSMLHVDSKTESAEAYFASLSTVDYGIVADFIYDSTTDTSNPAPEIAIIKVKDKGDIDAVIASLREHLEGRRLMFENYAAQIDEKQMPMIESAEVFSENDFVVLIVAENAKEVKEAFYEAIK